MTADEMRYGEGGFDEKNNRWFVRSDEFRKMNGGKPLFGSMRFLGERYGVELRHLRGNEAEKASRPYWRRYLADLRFDAESFRRKCREFGEYHDARVLQIETAFALSRLPKSMTEGVRVTLTRASEFTAESSDGIIPSRQTPPNERGDIGDGYGRMKTTKSPMLRGEVANWVARRKARGGKSWREHERYLGLLAGVCGGDVPLSSVTTAQYEKFLDGLPAEWSARTRRNAQQIVEQFLTAMERRHEGLRFGFVGDHELRVRVGKPVIRQWTVEEIRTALATATGVARTMILLALNCGYYPGDLVVMLADPAAKNVDGSARFDGERIVSGRAKHRHNPRANEVGRPGVIKETVETWDPTITSCNC